MEYQALYRKYRPQSFDEVIGQGHITATLTREVAEGRVAHSYLFAGPRGTGKTTTARILAKALNCERRHPDGSPCNECAACLAVGEGSSLDVLELDAASHNSVEDIRDLRVSVATVASSATSRRVFILDEAHMLSKAAGNALLKTLEEPPEHVYFVLATTEPYKLLDTIRSRAQRFDFHAVSTETLAAHLARICEAEGYRAEERALVAVARHARGSVRDSLSLLEQVAALGAGSVELAGVNRALGLAGADAFARLVESMGDEDARAALELVAELASQGVDLRRFTSEAVGFFRGAFLAHYAPNLAEVADEPPDVLDSWRRAASRLPAGSVLRAVDVLGEALVRLREGREERLMLELALIKLTRPETAPDADAILARVERLERRLNRAETQVPPFQMPAAEATVHVPAAEATLEMPVEGAAPDGEPAGVGPAAVGPAAEGGEAEPERAPVQDLTMGRVETIWPALFGGLRDVLGSRRWALFREAHPGAVEGSTLVLHVRHDFHLEALRSDPVVAAVVGTKAGDLLGGSVRVEFRPAEDAGAQAEEVQETEKDRLAEAPEKVDDPLELVTTELGAEIVDDDEGGTRGSTR